MTGSSVGAETLLSATHAGVPVVEWPRCSPERRAPRLFAPSPLADTTRSPPEPSDVIWENLGCADGLSRQLRGTFYMLLLSLMGAFLIGASAYLQPKATAASGTPARRPATDR